MTRAAFLSIVLTLVVTETAARGQLQPGDFLLSGTLSLVHVRGTSSQAVTLTLPGGATGVVPVAARPIEHVPGTQHVLIATTSPVSPTTNAGYAVYLVDFTNSISAPPATQLTSGFTATAADLDADVTTGDVYLLLNTGVILRFAAPVGPGSLPVPFAAAPGATSIAALPGGTGILASSATATWIVPAGATLTGPDLLGPAFAGRTAVAVHPQNGDIYVSRTQGGGFVDVFSGSGTFATTILNAPEIADAADVKLDVGQGRAVAVTPTGAVINGVPYGVQTGFDNVIVGNGLLAQSAQAQAFGPQAGNGFTLSPVRLATVRGIVSPIPSAHVTSVGQGCPGTGGLVPVLGTNGLPVLGSNAFGFTFANAPPGIAALLLVAGALESSPIPIGGSCHLYLRLTDVVALLQAGVNPFASTVIAPNGSATIFVPVPNLIQAAGVHLFFQGLILDPNGIPVSPGLGFTVTNALDCELGI